MFKVDVVEDCPHTGASGQLILPHHIIAALAGAVQDAQEWMALLKGKRSDDGLVTTVTHFKVPDHYRSAGAVELVRHEPLTDDIVGVVHSHHSFGAFFSYTDNTELNTRFPVSIVVARPRQSSKDEFYSLGFDYKAEGKVVLPCGSVGKVDYYVVPDPLPKNWTPIAPANFENPKTGSIGDCSKHTSRLTKVHEEVKTKCGLAFTRVLPSIFGTKDNLIMPQVLKRGQPMPTVTYDGGYAGGPENRVPGNIGQQYLGQWLSKRERKRLKRLGQQEPTKLMQWEKDLIASRDRPGGIRSWNEPNPPMDSRQPSSDQWGYWDVDGKYHRWEDSYGDF
jgi:proteasome lid subunit RPN8/RPN11